MFTRILILLQLLLVAVPLLLLVTGLVRGLLLGGLSPHESQYNRKRREKRKKRKERQDPSKPVIAYKVANLYPTPDDDKPFFGVGVKARYRIRDDAACSCTPRWGRNSPPPHDRGCGFWANRTYARAVGGNVLLKVALSGKVRHHGWGYMAQRQRVIKGWMQYPDLKQWWAFRKYYKGVKIRLWPNFWRMSPMYLLFTAFITLMFGLTGAQLLTYYTHR